MKQASTLHTQTLPHTTQPRNNQVLINLKSAMLGFFSIYAAIFGRRKLIQRGCPCFSEKIAQYLTFLVSYPRSL